MPPNTLIESLDRLWLHLESCDLRPILAGGLALAFWGNPRSTQDLDLALLAPDDKTFSDRLYAFGLRRKTADPISLGLFELSQWNLPIPESYLEIDVDFLISDSDYYVDVDRHAIAASFDGVSVPIRVMSVEDLIIHKVYAERLIDQADVVALVQQHRDRLNLKRIETWVGEFGCEAIWETCLDRSG